MDKLENVLSFFPHCQIHCNFIINVVAFGRTTTDLGGDLLKSLNISQLLYTFSHTIEYSFQKFASSSSACSFWVGKLLMSFTYHFLLVFVSFTKQFVEQTQVQANSLFYIIRLSDQALFLLISWHPWFAREVCHCPQHSLVLTFALPPAQKEFQLH